MMLHSTLLKVTKDLTKEVFLKLILEKSKQNQINLSDLKLPAFGVKNITFNKGRKTFSIAVDEKKGITAVRFYREEFDGDNKIREYVLNEKEHMLSIRYTAKISTESLDFPNNIYPNVPELLKQLMDKGYLASDGNLEISTKPIWIKKENFFCFRTLIEGNTFCQLPVIFLTPSVSGKYPIAVKKLAFQLFGMCHILVCEDKKLLRQIRKEYTGVCSSHNSVSILYPNQKNFSQVLFAKTKESKTEQLLHKIFIYSAIHPVAERYTYSYVSHTILQEQAAFSEKVCKEAQDSQKIAEQKHEQLLIHLDEEKKRLKEEAMIKALQEAEQIVISYEEDINSLQNELYEKTLLLQGLENENQRLKSQSGTKQTPVLYLGEEREFYLGEIQDLILSVLEDSLSEMPEKCRKKDVITDILASNNYKHISKNRNEQVKRLLKTYNGMSAKIRHGLEELGFLIEESNKHYKISYHGDNRYLAIFGSTPSDVRCGKNNAAILTKMAY